MILPGALVSEDYEEKGLFTLPLGNFQLKDYFVKKTYSMKTLPIQEFTEPFSSVPLNYSLSSCEFTKAHHIL